MKLTTVLTAGLAGTASAIKFMENDALAAKGMINLGFQLAENGYPSPETCTLKNLAIRREWDSLSRREKLDYINAVKCLHKLPAKTPASVAPGAKSRYDDLVVTHIQQSLHLHGTVSATYVFPLQLLTTNRETSSHGTAGILGRWSRCSGTNVDTRDTNHTITGLTGRRILRKVPSSTVATLACRVTEHMFLDATTHAFPGKTLAS